jgi:small subunit ribosomal protein S20
VKADQPIAGSSIYYLDSSETNNWRASAEIQTKGSSKTNDLTIPATVPGDLLSDLKAAGIIGEPYYEVNFRNSSLWDDNVWTYTIQFTTMSVLTIDSTSNNSDVVKALLVFDMANTAQTRKRARQTVKQRAHNVGLRSTLRTAIKKIKSAIEGGDSKAAKKAFEENVSVIDRIADKKIIHKNKAARHKSRLNTAIKSM